MTRYFYCHAPEDEFYACVYCHAKEGEPHACNCWRPTGSALSQEGGENAENQFNYEELNKLKEEVERLSGIEALYEAGCKQWNPVYKEVLDERDKLVERVSVLEAIGHDICSWDWSDNDDEPLADIERLRAALRTSEGA
jgi:hypothetical protein